MDSDKICVKSAKCRIYAGILESNEIMIDTYKSMYCENGKEGRDNCKRFQVSEVAGACPPDILPNSDLTVDRIIKLMGHRK